MKPYDPRIDYCGPGKSFLTKLIPNKLIGVSLNSCCYFHDMAYEIGGDGQDRMLADLRFKDCIFSKFNQKWWVPKAVAWWIAHRYYVVVRGFGTMSFTFTKESHRPEAPVPPPLRKLEGS